MAVPIYAITIPEFVYSTANILIFFVLPIFLVGGFLLYLKRAPTQRVMLLLNLGAVAGAVYILNLYYVLEMDKGKPVFFDRRSVAEVVLDHWAEGRGSVFPAMYPTLSPGFAIQGPEGTTLQALGGISNVVTVLCNESGTFAEYMSDRHGFNNPDTVWDE